MKVELTAVPERVRPVAQFYLQNYYRRFLDDCTDAIFICRDSRIVFLNAAAADLLGVLDRTQIVGRALSTFIQPGFYQAIERAIAKAIQRDARASLIEVQVVGMDGREITAELRASWLELDGNPAIQVNLRDVNERAREQRSLQEQYRALAALVSGLPGMAYRGGSGERTHHMQFVSDGCFELTGYRAQDLIDGAHVAYSDIICPEDRPRVREALRALRHDRFALRYRIVTADGRTRWVGDRGRLVRNPGSQALFCEGTVEDITAQIEAETALIERQEQLRLAVEESGQGWWEWGVASGQGVSRPDRCADSRARH
jgi:PAS domain S-box-containing protein